MDKVKNKIVIKFTFISIFFTIILGNISTFNIGSIFKGMPIKITEIIMAINILLIVIINGKKKINFKFNKILILWCVLGFFSIIINSFFYDYKLDEIMYGTLYCIRYIYYIIYAILVSNLFITNAISFNLIAKFMIKSYIVVCIIGIIQRIIWPSAIDFYNVLSKFDVYLLNPDPHINRIISTYLDPNYLGAILIIPLILCIILFLNESYRIFSSLSALLILLTILGTVSRSALLGIVISLLIMILLNILSINKMKKVRINKRILLIVYILLIVIPIFIYLNLDSRLVQRVLNFKSDPSAIARFSSWQSSFDIIKNNIIFGIGYNMIGFYTGNLTSMTSFGVDSSLLLAFITTGLIGAITYILYYYFIIRESFKKLKTNKYIYSGVISIVLGSLSMSFFNNLLFYPLWIEPFLILVTFILIDKEIK